MYDCILKDLKNNTKEEMLYFKILKVRVSQNCIGAAEDYFSMIAPLCLYNSSIALTLLRLAIRPLFYLGITEWKKQLTTYIK